MLALSWLGMLQESVCSMTHSHAWVKKCRPEGWESAPRLMLVAFCRRVGEWGPCREQQEGVGLSLVEMLQFF